MKLNSRFDAQLRDLKQALEEMTTLDLDCLNEVVRALLTGQSDPAEQVRSLALGIDRAERDIETLCLRILLQRHPVASDLRQVSGTLKMITDLQRIGHQCCDFADILLKDGPFLPDHLRELADLAHPVVEMLERASAACSHADVSVAQQVIHSDNEVDRRYASLRTRLAETIRTHATGDTDRLLDVLMLGKYLERMADHVVIFAQWIIFSVTGERLVPEEDAAADRRRDGGGGRILPGRGSADAEAVHESGPVVD